MSPRSAERLARAARAAQALSETLWEALLHEALADPAESRVAELSQRLADISATVALLARVRPGCLLAGRAVRRPRAAGGAGVAGGCARDTRAGAAAATGVSPERRTRRGDGESPRAARGSRRWP